MEQLAKLEVIFTLPPIDAAGNSIASVEIHCEELEKTYSADVFVEPLQPEERQLLFWYLEEYWKWPYLEFATRAREVEALLRTIGQRLYHQLFAQPSVDALVAQWLQRPAERHQINIISAIPRILGLPWELLHDAYGFISLPSLQRPTIQVVRCLSTQQYPTLETSFVPPLRILLVTARPESDYTPYIDHRAVAAELVDEMQEEVKQNFIDLEFLRPPTLKQLQQRLQDQRRPVHVLHFDGHGIFDQQSQQGLLYFEQENGDPASVRADQIAQFLHNTQVKLVVLTACQSAVLMGDTLGSFAARLMQEQEEVAALVAMSATVLVSTATRYVEMFYRSLSHGLSPQIAHEQAVQVLSHDPLRHPHRRDPQDEGSRIALCDWWVPQFYQQRSLFSLSAQRVEQPQKPIEPSLLRLGLDVPSKPRYGFIGRSYELLQIERALFRGKLVVLYGFGGIGKTILARECADWLTRTGMYESACFISFERGGGTDWLLSTLGRYLGIDGGDYQPEELFDALDQVQFILQKRRILVIADNIEEILPGGNAELASEERSELFYALLQLHRNAGVLLTSRNISFDDNRIREEEQKIFLKIRGLDPDSAYVLACQIMDTLGIDRAHAPYEAMRDLLVLLDHHPLAIQQVVPALQYIPLAQLASDFSALLERFSDDTETGRSRSLLASLEYSLRNISKDQQSLLPNLVYFEGGAWEPDLIRTMDITQREWENLRTTLMHAALLTTEQVYRGIDQPYISFHPIFIPYLRHKFEFNDTTLRQRYIEAYIFRADNLSQSFNLYLPDAQSLIRMDLANFRHALDLALAENERELALSIADDLDMFFTLFGFERERDLLWVRLENVFNEGKASNRKEDINEFDLEERLSHNALLKGHFSIAALRFRNLLTRMETHPSGSPTGPDSYTFCLILKGLAASLDEEGLPAEGIQHIERALRILDELIKNQPDDEEYDRRHRHLILRAGLLIDLGRMKRDFADYPSAQKMYQTALALAQRLEDTQTQAVVFHNLGILAFEQRDWAQAREHFEKALELVGQLNEPLSKARVLHELGMVAEAEGEWPLAEQRYRDSVALKEQIGNKVTIASTCYALASLQQRIGRLGEAEAWCKRALQLIEQAAPESTLHTKCLCSLSVLLWQRRLVEPDMSVKLSTIRTYATQALTLIEKQDQSMESARWQPLLLLALISRLEQRSIDTDIYRQRAYEAFITYMYPRYPIDPNTEVILSFIARGALGDTSARSQVEESFPLLEEKGLHITDQVRRIWVGERDWLALVDSIGDMYGTYCILFVLELIRRMQNSSEAGSISGGPMTRVQQNRPSTSQEPTSHDKKRWRPFRKHH